MVISATPAPGAAPAPVVIPQPAPVQLVSQPAPAPVVIQYSGGGHDTSMMAPTPALTSAPTPAPILMNNTAPNHPPPTVVSSNAPLYSFDPSGLTPAQQLAYAQAQQQHQQQHLKKMRQRLPHGGKSQGSPHMSRKLDGPAGMIGGAHLPSAALLHEAILASSVVSSRGPSNAAREHE